MIMGFGKPIAVIASMATLAGMLAAPSAFAAGNTGISINPTSSGTLAGHTFTAYELGTYQNVAYGADGDVSSYELKGSDKSNALVQAAVDAYNNKDQDATDDIAIPTSGDKVGALAKADAAQLRDLANRMAKDTANLPDAAAADQKGGAGALHLDVPDGLYLITDSAGVPMIVSTQIGGKGFKGVKLGQMTVKSTATTVDKKLDVNGTLKDNGSLSVGSTATWRISVSLPNAGTGTTTSVKLVDAPVGEKFTGDLGDISATVDGDDVSELLDKVAGGAQIAANQNIPNDKALDVPAGGFGVGLDKVAAQYAGKTVEITAKTIITSTDAGRHPQRAYTVTNVYDGTTPPTPPEPPTPPTDGSCPADSTPGVECVNVPVVSYGFDLDKTSVDDETAKVSGAGFKIKGPDGSWLSWDAKSGAWSAAKDKDSATEFLTGDTDHDGTVSDKEKSADTAGRITFKGLGAGQYTVEETTTPAGYSSFSKPSFTATITDAGKISFKGAAPQDYLTKDDGDGTVTVKNATNLAQLPQTGGVYRAATFLLAAAAVAMAAAPVARKALAKRRESEKPITA